MTPAGKVDERSLLAVAGLSRSGGGPAE